MRDSVAFGTAKLALIVFVIKQGVVIDVGAVLLREMIGVREVAVCFADVVDGALIVEVTRISAVYSSLLQILLLQMALESVLLVIRRPSVMP